ncbi:MAG: DUF5685 family protein [Eubacteriales bacterium]|nr:DUF5685 family protein [Eubacteriales bacterium]
MFGYTRPVFTSAEENLERSYSEYYCGLCLALGELGKLRYRFLLSYDLCFFAIFFSALDSEAELVMNAACPLPSIQRPKARRTRFTDLAATLSPLLFAAKIEDDRADGQRLRASGASALLIGRQVEAARRSWPEAAALIEAYDHEASLEGLVERFGELMGELFKLAAKKLKPSPDPYFKALAAEGLHPIEEAAYRIGAALGEWITLLDALDDEVKDRRRARDNYLNHLNSEELQALPARILDLEAELRRHAALLPFQRQTLLLRQLILSSFPSSRAEVFKKSQEQSVTMNRVWQDYEVENGSERCT